MSNPVVFKETREYPKSRRMRFSMLLNSIFYPCMFVAPFLVVTTFCLYTDRGFNVRWFLDNLDEIVRGSFIFSTVIQFFYLLIASTNGTLYAFTREREQKTYDSLMSTLLSPREIMNGKLIVGLYPVLKTLLMYSPLFVLIGLFSEIPLRGLLIVMAYSVGFCLFCGVSGLFVSAFSTTTVRAHALIASLLGGIIVVPFIFDYFINVSLYHFGLFHDPIPFFTLVSPGLGYASAACWYSTTHFHWFWGAWIAQTALMLIITAVLWKMTMRKIGSIPTK